MTCIALVTAIDPEFRTLRELLDQRTAERSAHGLQLIEGTLAGLRTLLVCTGMGLDRAGAAIAQVLATFPVDVVINAGIAGGLAADVQPGELYFCETITREATATKVAVAIRTDDALRAQASAALSSIQLPHRSGHLVSVGSVVGDPQRKQQLVGALGCDLVDMEAHALAAACQERGVPLLCLKAISDLADLRLTNLRALFRLKRNMAHALQRLQIAVRQIITASSDQPAACADVLFRETADRAGFVRAVIDRHVDRVRGKRVLVKPNIVSFEGYPTTTHPATLDAVIAQLKALDCQIVVGDGPAIDAHPARVMREHVLCEVCRRHGIQAVNFYATPTERRQASHGSYRLPRLIKQCDFFISLPVLKVHSLEKLVLTGALKNQFGLLSKTARLKFHTAYFASSAPIHRCIAEVNSLARPDLFIVDAVDVLVGANELRHGGSTAHLGYLCGGTDPVALDAFGLSLLQRLDDARVAGKHPLEIGYLRLAAWEYGLGNPAYRAVELSS